jgi:1-acyl-sn-glycerol-3-phosphate acyltransferase
MKSRDKNDSSRSVAPAVAAEDAILLDNSDLSVEETIDEVIRIINEKKNKVSEQKPFYRWFHSTFKGLFKFLFRIKSTGAENLPQYNGCIVCANHVSLFDVFSISASLPVERRLRYLAKAELFRIPLLRTAVSALGAFKVDRKGGDVGAIKKSVSLLKEGEVIGIFPQGTRCRGKNPAETEVKHGAGMIAYYSKVPVLPVAIRTKKQKYALFRQVEVIFGTPMSYEDLGFEKGGSKEYKVANRLNDGTMAAEFGGGVEYAGPFCHTFSSLVPASLLETKPELFALGVAAQLLGPVLPSWQKEVATVGANVVMCCRLVLLQQGLSVLQWWMREHRVPVFTRVFLLLMALWLEMSFALTSIAGILDVIFNLRHIPRRRPQFAPWSARER